MTPVTLMAVGPPYLPAIYREVLWVKNGKNRRFYNCPFDRTGMVVDSNICPDPVFLQEAEFPVGFTQLNEGCSGTMGTMNFRRNEDEHEYLPQV